MIEQVLLLLRCLLFKKKSIYFRIENYSQFHHFRPVIKLLIESGESNIVLLCRDYKNRKYDEPDRGFYLAKVDARLSPFIFRYHAFIAVSQNMRPPFFGGRRFLMPYGYFAKGISLPRFREGYDFFCSLCPFMSQYIKRNYREKITVLSIGYPKSDEYFSRSGKRNINSLEGNSVLVAPSHELESALLENIGDYLKEVVLLGYSPVLKVHPVYLYPSSAYRKKIDEIVDEGICTGVKILFPGEDELVAYRSMLTITDYSSIANEAMSAGRGVILVDSPKFYNEFLKRKYPSVSWDEVINDPATSSCYGEATVISTYAELSSAIENERIKCDSNSRKKYVEDLLFNRGRAANAIADVIRGQDV